MHSLDDIVNITHEVRFGISYISNKHHGSHRNTVAIITWYNVTWSDSAIVLGFCNMFQNVSAFFEWCSAFVKELLDLYTK